MSDASKGKLEFIAKMVFSGVFIVIGVVFVWADDPVNKSLGAGFLGAVAGYWIR